jgi:DNA primase large subunit
MDFEPDLRHLARFPFLKKSQEFVKTRYSGFESLLSDPGKPHLLEAAERRITNALSGKKVFVRSHAPSPEDEIVSYALARIIVSCINDRTLIDRLTRYEAERAYGFLVREGEDDENIAPDERGYSPLCTFIAHNIGLDIAAERIPLTDYVELAAPLHEDRWRLVNRDLVSGKVSLRQEEVYELMRERIRVIMRRDLPYRVPPALCTELGPACAKAQAEYQARILEQFGAVEEGCYPPCITALVTAISAGTSITHMGRFALTAFMHNIGMNTTQIAGLFSRAPDFDAAKTMYQVEHISGRGGTEYTAPACAAMRTNGICVNKDSLCEKVSHPLSYYKVKKRGGTFRQPARAQEPRPRSESPRAQGP